MANEENLIPLNRRTKSEQREIQSAGGKASGASRRKTASLKRAAKIFFQENPDAAMSIVTALYDEACSGNVKAAEKLQDLICETVQREELALKKKAIAKQEKPNNGKAEQLIAGLQEVTEPYGLHEEAAGTDAAVAAEEAETPESP